MPSENNEKELLKRLSKEMLNKQGLKVEETEEGSNFDFRLKAEDYKIAVQVKSLKKAVNVASLQKFIHLMQLSEGQNFDIGLMLSSSGFSKAAVALLESTDNKKIILAKLDEKGELIVIYSPTGDLLFDNATDQWSKERTYIGVFTAKGGVGKTTVAAHLAGAMALCKYEVSLLDLDPQQNLRRLLPEGAYICSNPQRLGVSVDVLTTPELESSLDENIRFVVCDCSPEFHNNPPELVKRFNYCIIPTTLNPLGLNKNGSVILSTIEQIRSINKHAFLFVLINGYRSSGNKGKMQKLLAAYRQVFQQCKEQDNRFVFIDPEECSIRDSDLLYYWGLHLFQDEDERQSTLAFDSVTGRCYPKEDFLNLVDYLREHEIVP